jgi:hypothetical protein
MIVDPAGFRSASRYDDVWSRDTELCPYCAREVAYEDEKCPQCNRSLISWHFRYEQPGANLHILWVLLAGLGQLYLINTALDIVLGAGLPLVVLHSLFTLIFFGLAVAVYYRQVWAHTTTIVLTLILLFLRLIDILGMTADFLPDPADPLQTLFISPVLNFLLDAVDVMQLAALALALVWAALLTGADFERKRSRQRASVSRQLQDPSSFYVVGRQHARRGEWASAVLHWQRAVARAPTNRHYHRRLGQGYAQLGFFERSEDALGTARELTADPAERQQVEQLLARVRRQRNAAVPNNSHGK